MYKHQFNRLTVFPVIFCFFGFTYLFAQTEFQGNVSGEWNVEGSPYIQVGDATVPQDETLTIRPGVEVIFGEDLTLTVNGGLTATGTEDDTIRFHGPEGLVSGSLLLNTGEDTISFQYCRFDSLANAIWANEDTYFGIYHSLFYENHYAIGSKPLWVEVAYSSFISFSRTCYIRLGNDQRQGLYRHTNSFFHDNRLFGRLSVQFRGVFADVVNNQSESFITPDHVYRTSMVFSECQNLYCEANDSMTIATDNLNVRLESATFRDNILFDGSGVGGGGVDTLIFLNNRCTYVNYNNVHSGNISGNIAIGQYLFEGGCQADFRYNLGCIAFEGDDNVLRISNCTMVREVAIHLNPSAVINLNRNGGQGNQVILSNNILYGRINASPAVSAGIEVSGSGYNVIWGVEEVYGGIDDLLDNDRIAYSGLRGGFPFDYRLRADSPCIDAGDPDSPEDPDGTRADIGCYYFDQENGEPPALDRHWDYYIGWGETFRYGARAVDEGDELAISFEGLPEWLEIEEEERRDFVRDSVFISGVVPEDQEDFVFRVTVSDDRDETDTLSVRVMVYPYRVLTGIVHGVLDIDQSPFIVADTAWVPAGDSLVLPPGTELYFDNRVDTLAGRTKSMLMVLGSIKAVGAEEDSVYLNALEDQDNLCIDIASNLDATNEFSYCYLKQITFNSCLPVYNIQFRDCLLETSSVQAGGYNTIIDIRDNQGNSSRIRLFGNAVLTGNESIGLSINEPDSIVAYENSISGSRLSIWFGSRLEAESRYVNMNNNDISNGVNATLYYPICDEYFYFHNNHIIGGQPGLDVSGMLTSYITNNLILGQEDRLLEVNPFDRPTWIINNIMSSQRNEEYIGIGIYARYSRDYEERFRNNLKIENNVFACMDTLLYSYRNRTEGIRYNSFSDFNFLSNDTTFNASIAQTNINGDSCDANFNIYLNPRLANPDSLDFRLYLDSPLINAGNPDSLFNDVDGSINDIGLSGGPCGQEPAYLDTNEVISFADTPGSFQVGQAYPNPFNSTSNISVEVPHNGTVAFSLFDIQGRRVAASSIQLTAGIHRHSLSEFLQIDTGRLRSGLYVLTIEYGGSRIHRKLVLVK